MKADQSSPQQAAQASFRAFVDETILPYASRYEQDECLPAGLIAELARLGYLGAALPNTYGGQGMDAITYGVLNEELGRGSSSVRGLVMVQNMVACTLAKWGNETQRAAWPHRIASGEVIAALALTEPEVGSDIKEVATTAERADGGYAITGCKTWISFGQIAALFLVLGRCEGNLCAFLVERDSPGLSIEPINDLSGLRATQLARLHFDACRVPADNLVGAAGFGLAPVVFTALDLGRYSIAWGCVGLAQACLEACLEHTRTRQQFGACLNQHQLIQHMITDMLVNVRAARLLCVHAGQQREAGAPDAFLDTLMAKYFASTMATRVASDAAQIHGASGFQNGHVVQRHLRDARAMELIEGTTQIHQIKIAEYACQAHRSG